MKDNGFGMGPYENPRGNPFSDRDVQRLARPHLKDIARALNITITYRRVREIITRATQRRKKENK